MRFTTMLVLALTVGLLGMHALGPAAALPSPVTVERTSHHVATTDAGQHCPCPDDDHDTGRHISHTDMMCASASLPNAPGNTAPDDVPVTGAEHDDADAFAPAPNLPSAACEAVGKRAPPSLADVAFAQGMIPHHRQAVVMSDMARPHGASNAVKALAERIKKAQQPEIDAMADWLRAWGERGPSGMGGMDGMGHRDGAAQNSTSPDRDAAGPGPPGARTPRTPADPATRVRCHLPTTPADANDANHHTECHPGG
ncbi:DUF6153 family protein [Streptomyces xanthophaeus]